jgi:hypothetical protein
MTTTGGDAAGVGATHARLLQRRIAGTGVALTCVDVRIRERHA